MNQILIFKIVQLIFCENIDSFEDNSYADSCNQEEPLIKNMSVDQLLAPASIEVKQFG